MTIERFLFMLHSEIMAAVNESIEAAALSPEQREIFLSVYADHFERLKDKYFGEGNGPVN